MNRMSVSVRWMIYSAVLLLMAVLVEFIDRKTFTEQTVQSADASDFLETIRSKSTMLHQLLLKTENSRRLHAVRNFDNGTWRAIIVQNNLPVFWSGSELDFDTVYRQLQQPDIVFTRNSVFYIIPYHTENVTVVIAYPLQKSMQGKTYLNMQVKGAANSEITTDSTSVGVSVNPSKNLYFSTLNTEHGSLLAWMLATAAFLAIFWSVSFFSWYKDPWWVRLVCVAYLLFFRWIIYEKVVCRWFDHLEIFDPTIYASSFLLPSLGDLLLHVVFASTIITLVLQPAQHANKQGWYKWVVTVFVAVTAFFGADLAISLIKGLVIDSSISFDPGHLADISVYSIIAALLAGIIVYLLLRLVNGLIASENLHTLNLWQVAALTIPGALFYVIFQIFDGHRPLDSLWFPLLTAYWFLTIGYFRWMRQNTGGLILLVFVCSTIAATAVYNYNQIHEKEFLGFYANKLVSEKDLEAEYEFKRIENNLVAEFLVPEDFANFVKKKDLFEQRLRRLYFTGYLDKYDVRVFSFDSLGNSITGVSEYDLPYLSNLYDFNAMPTVSNHFYHIKDPLVINGYIARFDNCDLQGHNGSTFLLLQPKFIQIPHIFPRLLNKGKPNSGYDLSQYAYGIYVNGRLMHQRGEFAYPIHFSETAFKNSGLLSFKESFRHFVSNQGPMIKVVLSRSYSDATRLFSIFTFLFILFLIGFLCWILILLGIQWLLMLYTGKSGSEVKKKPDVSVMLLQTLKRGSLSLLSSRIRMALLVVLVAGLLVSVFLTIRYVRLNHNQRITETLTGHLLEAANQLQNEADLRWKLSTPEPRQLLVNQISDLNKSVFHLYDANGMLIATSEPQLFDQKILGRMINPVAYNELNDKQVSQYQHIESLAGIDYHSAYVPLLDENRNTLAYLNTPYFSEQEEINQEVSNFLMAYVNLYFVLFMAALGLAWFITSRITRPLTMIKEKISHMVLGSRNEMIDWNRNDEIGQLVRQYNKMVLELEESANKLSASERELAWREMARQVAHEIKNPLTPMKLNIQHLQRAWTDKNEKLDQTFEKVTRVLIEQIDSLSNLASSFSDFAKMPTERFEVFNLAEVAENCVHLFEKSSDVHFEFSAENGNIQVFADKEQINRVLNNLIKNAIQAFGDEQNGNIRLAVVKKDKWAVVSVKDNGPGIPDEILDKIFVPNFSTKTSGMGLGLAISKKIIETAGGSISFDTKSHRGTVFTIKLPLHTSHA